MEDRLMCSRRAGSHDDTLNVVFLNGVRNDLSTGFRAETQVFECFDTFHFIEGVHEEGDVNYSRDVDASPANEDSDVFWLFGSVCFVAHS